MGKATPGVRGKRPLAKSPAHISTEASPSPTPSKGHRSKLGYGLHHSNHPSPMLGWTNHLANASPLPITLAGASRSHSVLPATLTHNLKSPVGIDSGGGEVEGMELEGSAKKLRKRPGRKGQTDKDDDKQSPAMPRPALSRGGTQGLLGGKSKKTLTWDDSVGLGGTMPMLALPQSYDSGPGEDEEGSVAPSHSSQQAADEGQADDEDDGGDGLVRVRTGSSGQLRRRKSGGSRGSNRSSNSSRSSRQLGPDDKEEKPPSAATPDRGRSRSRSRGGSGSDRGGGSDSGGRGRSGSSSRSGSRAGSRAGGRQNSAGTAAGSSAVGSGSRVGSRGGTAGLVTGWDEAQVEKVEEIGQIATGAESPRIWSELSRRGSIISSQAGAGHWGSTRHTTGHTTSTDTSFLELEQRWGVPQIGTGPQPTRELTPQSAKVLRSSRQRKSRLEGRRAEKVTVPTTPPPMKQLMEQTSRVSQDVLSDMLSRTGSGESFSSLSSAEETDVTPARRRSRVPPAALNTSPPPPERRTLLMGSPHRVVQRTYERALEMMHRAPPRSPPRLSTQEREKSLKKMDMVGNDIGGPPVFLTKEKGGVVPLAKNKEHNPVVTVDTNGCLWTLVGVPAPDALKTDVSFAHIDPYPVFESKIGTKPTQSPADPTQAADATEEALRNADLNFKKELKSLSEDEVRALMEQYFPSLEVRLRKVHDQGGDLDPESPENQLKGTHGGALVREVLASSVIHWPTNSLAKKELERARNDPQVQERLRRLVEEVIPAERMASRRNAPVDHVKRNAMELKKPREKKQEAGTGREDVLMREEHLRMIEMGKEKRQQEMREMWVAKKEERAERRKMFTVQQMWKKEQQRLQALWLSALAASRIFEKICEPIFLRRQSSKIVRSFIVSTLIIQRWLRKVIYKNRNIAFQKVTRIGWRRYLDIRIKRKRRYCAHIIEFLREYKKRNRAITAMDNFRSKVSLIQRTIRQFLVQRRMRWMLLAMQWTQFEKARNKELKKRWRVAWNGMMFEISKVFKMPPSRLRRDLSSKSIRWVTEMMDGMIASLPDEIKNIIVVSKETREKVLEDEKKIILRRYLKDLKHYQLRVIQVRENKAIKDLVQETFPGLSSMSAVSSPELQFLLDSDKLPPQPELNPLLPEARLWELLKQAHVIEKEEEEKQARLSRGESIIPPPSRAGSFREFAEEQLKQTLTPKEGNTPPEGAMHPSPGRLPSIPEPSPSANHTPKNPSEGHAPRARRESKDLHKAGAAPRAGGAASKKSSVARGRGSVEGAGQH